MSAGPAVPTRELILPRRRRSGQRTSHHVTPQPTGGAVTGPARSAELPTEQHEVMNTVLHHALRRDLRRLAETLRTPVGAPVRRALTDHIRFVLEQLHHHHTTEDELIWPAVLLRRPDLRGSFDEMQGEHDQLGSTIATLTAAAAAWSNDSGRPAVHEAVVALEQVLEPHLEHEEADAMPLICSVLTAADWAPIDKNLHRPTWPSKMAAALFWMLDDLDPARSEVVEGLLPQPLWRLLRLRYAAGWRRRQAVLWG